MDLFDLFDENVNGTSDLNRGTYPTTLLAALSPTLKPENAPFSPTRCTRRHVCKSSGFPRCLIKACCSNQERMLSGCSANCPNSRQKIRRTFGENSGKHDFLFPHLFHCFHGRVALDSHAHLLTITSSIRTLAKHKVYFGGQLLTRPFIGKKNCRRSPQSFNFKPYRVTMAEDIRASSYG